MVNITQHGGAESCVVCDKDGTVQRPTLAFTTNMEDSAGEQIWLKAVR